jgi:hypothetical protein
MIHHSCFNDNNRLVDGVTLQRNGQGVRLISFLGMNIKIYVAGFYSPSPLISAEQVLECRDCPMQLDFTFLRDVSQSKMTYAWKSQLEYSVTYSNYDGYERDRDAFIAMFGPIPNGGTESVQLVGEDTLVVDQGVYKGRITGRNFQMAFLSMWFGDKAVSDDLKAGLLSGLSSSSYNHHNPLHHRHRYDDDTEPQQQQQWTKNNINIEIPVAMA